MLRDALGRGVRTLKGAAEMGEGYQKPFWAQWETRHVPVSHGVSAVVAVLVAFPVVLVTFPVVLVAFPVMLVAFPVVLVTFPVVLVAFPPVLVALPGRWDLPCLG